MVIGIRNHHRVDPPSVPDQAMVDVALDQQEEKHVDLGYFDDLPTEEKHRGRPNWLVQNAWLAFPALFGQLSQGMMYGRLHPMRNRELYVISTLDPENEVTGLLMQWVTEYLSYPVTDAHGQFLFDDHSFGNLVRLVHPVFDVLCYELYATYQCRFRSTSYSSDDNCQFRLGGVDRQCSLWEFGHRIGLYAEVLDVPALRQHFSEGVCVGSEDFKPGEFWEEVGTDDYRSDNKVSSLRTLPLRVLAKLIIIHISHRQEASKLNSHELFYLWCFYTGRHLNLPRILAFMLSRYGGVARPTSPILGGHLITTLARSYFVDTTGLVVHHPRPWGHSAMYNGGLIHNVDDAWLPLDGPAGGGGDDAPGEAPVRRVSRTRSRDTTASQASIDHVSSQVAQLNTIVTDMHGDIRSI